MTDKSPTIHLNLQEYQAPTEYRPGIIKWCEKHWAHLMFALKDRGMDGLIAEDDEALSRKLAQGEGDPCWEAFTAVNVGAMSIFGPEKIIEEYGGCPCCAFADMAVHAADLVTLRYKEPH